ncbi:unnamed protein product [Amoebophrya sp. A120]|nr:unnamed protein product [Amoebophrya sp. A120]|eukprot:GSA120T00012326001.1
MFLQAAFAVPDKHKITEQVLDLGWELPKYEADSSLKPQQQTRERRPALVMAQHLVGWCEREKKLPAKNKEVRMEFQLQRWWEKLRSAQRQGRIAASFKSSLADLCRGANLPPELNLLSLLEDTKPVKRPWFHERSGQEYFDAVMAKLKTDPNDKESNKKVEEFLRRFEEDEHKFLPEQQTQLQREKQARSARDPKVDPPARKRWKKHPVHGRHSRKTKYATGKRPG